MDGSVFLVITAVAAWYASRAVTKAEHARTDMNNALRRAADLKAQIGPLMFRAGVAMTTLAAIIAAALNHGAP